LGLALALAAPASAATRHKPAASHVQKSRAKSARRITPVLAGATDPAKDAELIEDGFTGKVLYARNETALRHPASLTKMMTLYLLFEALRNHRVTMETPMPVSAHASVQKPTKLYLKPGQTINVDTAIRAIVIRSANDVAVVIAEALGGTESHFAEMMTAKARQLGMRDTNYHNASGLPDPLQITTAADLAILARHLAYDFPQYFPYFGTSGFTYKGTYYPTHDNLIGRYQGADGIKTGYTGASGFNLATSVVRGGVHLIGIVMGGRTAVRRDLEMMHILDTAFAKIDDNPAMVARGSVPWQNLAAIGVPPGPQVAQAARNPFTATAAVSPPAGDDEDAAEARRAPDENYSVIHAEAPQLADVAAPPAPAVPPANANLTAIPAPRPPQADTGEGDSDSPAPRNWVIQIGAYANQTLARSRLETYAARAKDVLGDAARIIAPIKQADGRKLYRARFGLYAEQEARDMCGRLTQRGQTCIALTATR
jgi:D-alanyl-D-alanine carboxypeptidase